MPTVLVYRSTSASFAAKRVAAASNGDIRAVQQDAYRHQPDDTAIVRWDCYEPLNSPASVLDINPHTAVQLARDKGQSRRHLGDLAPPTWFTPEDVQLPCVVRPRKHKAGFKFLVCRTSVEVRAATRRCGTGWYASQLIDKAREFRVFVVQGLIAAVSERFPGNDHAIAWNLALGGRLVNINRPDWPVPALKASIEAMRRIGLGFGAVDACIDADGRTWIFEVNTSPALKNAFTIKQLAKALSSPFVEAGHLGTPVRDSAKKSRSFAHPEVGGDPWGAVAPPAERAVVTPHPADTTDLPTAVTPSIITQSVVAQPAPQPMAVVPVHEEPTMPFVIPSTFNAALAEASGLTAINIIAAPSNRTVGWVIDKAQELGASHFAFDGQIYDTRTLQVVYRRAA